MSRGPSATTATKAAAVTRLSREADPPAAAVSVITTEHFALPAPVLDDLSVDRAHLDKVFFPDDGITKGDLVNYYQEMAPHILGYLRDRPLVLDRYPDGIAGQRIVQKNAGKHFPDWVRRTEVGKQGGAVCHVVADRPDTLVYLANQGTIEFHVFLSRVPALDQPDQLVFDLDPPSGDRFDDVRRHALHLRGLLEDELGLTTT